MADLERRVSDHESRIRILETTIAANAVVAENISRRLMGIEETLKWIVKLIIGALLMAALTFAMTGGFNV